MKTAIEPDKMSIVLAGQQTSIQSAFKNALARLKLPYSLAVLSEGKQLLEYLDSEACPPHLIFLDAGISEPDVLGCLRQISKDTRLNDTSIALYSDSQDDDTLTQYYLAGANICIRTPENLQDLEKIATQVVHMNWQYLTNGLDREKFILKY